MTTTYQNQSIAFTDLSGNLATISPAVGFTIQTPTQTLTANVDGFTNGVQNLLFSDLYAGVEKTKSIKFLTSTPTKLSVVDTIEVVDDITTPNYIGELLGQNLTFTEIATGNYSSLGNNGFTIVDNTDGESNTIDVNSITMVSPSGGFNQLILSNDISVSEPFLRMDNSSGITTNYLASALNQSSNLCYVFDNGTRFFKQNNPFSFKQYELVDADIIEPYMPFVFIQNGTSLNLRKIAEYLDDNGNAGWSFIISNYSGSSIDIDINNASSWYSNQTGGGLGNPINIPKWITCRITLVYSSIDNEYIYAVAEY
jgi:hypothetical protein